MPKSSDLMPIPLTVYKNISCDFMNYSFVSDYAGDLLIERSDMKNDMIVAILHLEVDNMVDWSAKPMLTLNL